MCMHHLIQKSCSIMFYNMDLSKCIHHSLLIHSLTIYFYVSSSVPVTATLIPCLSNLRTLKNHLEIQLKCRFLGPIPINSGSVDIGEAWESAFPDLLDVEWCCWPKARLWVALSWSILNQLLLWWVNLSLNALAVPYLLRLLVICS